MENSINFNDEKIQKMLTNIMNKLKISIDVNTLENFQENHQDTIEKLLKEIQGPLTDFIKNFKNQSIESDDSIQISKDEQFQESLIELYNMISNKQEGGLFNQNGNTGTSSRVRYGRNQRRIGLERIENVVNNFLRANNININENHPFIPILIIVLAIYSYFYVDTQILVGIAAIIFGILMSNVNNGNRRRRGGKSSKKRHTKKNRKTKRRSKTSRRHKHRR